MIKPPILVDVRALPVWERHPRIFTSFDALDDDTELRVTTDHEPRPLHAEFEDRRSGLFVWSQRSMSDGRWEARIRKTTGVDGDEATRLIRRCALFADASDAVVADLGSRARRATIRRHRAIVEQGISWPYVGIVFHGFVQGVVATPDGREIGVHDVLPGELFGIVSLLDGGPSALRYVARGHGTAVMLLPCGPVIAALHHEEPIASAAAAISAERMRVLIEHVSALTTRPILARVAQALLAYARPERGLVEPLPSLREMRQIDLAVAAGTAKDMVYRALGEMEAAGALQRRAGRIIQLDRTRLMEFARGVKYE